MTARVHNPVENDGITVTIPEDHEKTPLTWKDLISNMYIQTMGNMHISNAQMSRKKHMDIYNEYERNVVLYTWDATPNCTATIERVRQHELHLANPDEYEDVFLCPTRDICNYKKIGKCSTQLSYIKAVVKFLVTNYWETITETQMFQFGMHILPLYRMLCKFKIEELSLESSLFRTSHGIRANPLYKEIRDTMSLIMKMWRDVGILIKSSEFPDPGDFMDGSGNYYDTMGLDGSGGPLGEMKPLERDPDGRPIGRASRNKTTKRKKA